LQTAMQTLPDLPSPTAKYRLIEVFMPWAEDPPELWPLNLDRAWIVYCLATGQVVGETFTNETAAENWLDQMNNPEAYPENIVPDAKN
jgi:hypothetical protein